MPDDEPRPAAMDIEEYARHRHFYDDEVPPLLDRELQSRSWKSYADLGCGDGSLLLALRARGYFRGREVHALDLSRTRIDRVRVLCPEVDASVGSAQDLQGFPDGSLDFVVSTQVIEHVPDDQKMISEIARVLAPGGTAYLTTIYKKWYGWYFYRCNGRWVIDPTHLREYRSDAELLGDGTPAGLTVVENRKTPLAFPLADFFLRRAGADSRVYSNARLRALRGVRVPIPGYHNWELVLRKSERGKVR
jgi:2-polyprenyl-3-methyl-5-hydroxy-6-metoxy-1,4-benzoquinol methylase